MNGKPITLPPHPELPPNAALGGFGVIVGALGESDDPSMCFTSGEISTPIQRPGSAVRHIQQCATAIGLCIEAVAQSPNPLDQAHWKLIGAEWYLYKQRGPTAFAEAEKEEGK